MNIIRNLKLRILIRKNIKNLKEIKKYTIKSIEELERQKIETKYNVMYEFKEAVEKEIDFYRRSIKKRTYKDVFNISELKTRLEDFEKIRSKVFKEYCFITILNIFEDTSYTSIEWIDVYNMLIILKEYNIVEHKQERKKITIDIEYAFCIFLCIFVIFVAFYS
nr:MAG TPA: hypothetical protein [Caudoviricetes sp.]